MTELLLDIVSWVLLSLGGACVLVGGVGGLRLPNFYTRVHAASLTDTMATLLIFSGMMLQAGISLASVKLFAIMLFLLLTGPTATYALVNAAMLSGLSTDTDDASADSAPATTDSAVGRDTQ